MIHWLTQSYWRDEAFSILLAKKSFLEIIQLSAGDFSPPLYHLLLKMWLYPFGESEVSSRLFSVLCFMCLSGVLILFARRVYKLSWLSSVSGMLLLTSSCPILVYYAFEARMYALSALLATASYYFFLRKNSRWYLFVTIAGIYTHYFMLFVVGTQIAYTLISLIDNKRKRILQKSARSSFLNTLDIKYAVLAICSFIPWILLTIILRNTQSSGSFWIPKPNIYELLTSPAILATGFERGLPYKYNMWPLTIVIGSIIVLSLLKKSAPYVARIAMLILWSFGPATFIWTTSQFAIPLFLPRYLIVSVPALLLLIAISLHQFKLFFRIFGFALIIWMFWNYQTIQLFMRTKQNLRHTIQNVSETAERESYLLVTSELDYHIAQVYWHDPNKVKITGKSYEDIPSYVGKVLISKDSIVSQEETVLYRGYVLSNGRIVSITKYNSID